MTALEDHLPEFNRFRLQDVVLLNVPPPPAERDEADPEALRRVWPLDPSRSAYLLRQGGARCLLQSLAHCLQVRENLL